MTSEIVQIAILYVVFYAVLRRARGSRFGQALVGVAVLAAAAALFTYVLKFEVLALLVRWMLLYLALSTVVIFQPEIRRSLAAIGALGIFDRPSHGRTGAVEPDYVVETILALSKRRMGALFAFERGISLRGYEDSGVPLDALFTRALVTAVFTPPLPLHDGGLTLRDGRISAAHCVFPVSNNPDLVASGMRHRAAVGLSEETDALVVVVSEESGTISVAHNGRLFRFRSEQAEVQLRRWVVKAMRDNRRRGLAARLMRLFARRPKEENAS